MKNNKKPIFIVLTLSITIGAFLITKQKEKTEELTKIGRTQVNTEKQGSAAKPLRAPASIPQAAPIKKIAKQKEIKRKVIGKIQDKESLAYSNKVNKEWLSLYKHSFLRMVSTDNVSDFKVKKVKSILKVKNNIGHNYEHIIVSYKKPNGDPFSFEALIDSQTGHMVQTWNQTRYEIRNQLKLDGSRNAYKE